MRYIVEMQALGASGDDESPVSMAARRREFVAREIEEAALRLFDERGYENVTVADIADGVGISRRTFFRYFASKEHVLRAHSARLQARVVRALEHRPPDEPAAVALCNAIIDTADVAPQDRASMLLRNRVLRQLEWQSWLATTPPEIGSRLVELVATRMGLDPDSDLRPRLVVATVWSAADVATAHWVATTDDAALTSTLREAFAAVMKGLERLDRGN
jgi:AcrR family transcriptional regulator